MLCPTAWGQWAAQLLQCTASLPWGSGQWNSRNALPHCPGGVGSATPAMHCLTAWGQWTVQLLQCTASLPRNSGQCNSCNALPHCLGAMGSATPAIHCRTAALPWGSLTVPRAEAAGTMGRGVPGDGAWHWDVRAPDTVSTPPTGGARALSFGASHPAPSP